MSRLPLALLLASALLLATSAPTPGPVVAQAAPPGKVLGPARGQVAWLDLLAPRPTPLTQLAKPAYAADVAAAPGVPYAVASIVGTFPGASGALGADLSMIDLASSTSHTLASRQSDSDSLDLPAIWPDGSAILYQRSNLHAPIGMPGQAQPQYMSRIEQVDPDGQNAVPLLDNARYPGPAPDGTHFAFVRSSERGAGIYVHSTADGSDLELVTPGQFLAVAYPRFSPDGQQIAFVAIPLAAPIGAAPNTLVSWFTAGTAFAHGFPWEAWIVSADGSAMHQIPDLVDDDPSIAWSPDGSQLMVFGGWGSFLVDAATGSVTSIPYVAGYGSVAWLPD